MPKQPPLNQLGAVERHNEQYRAHVQYRNGESLNVNIRGPDRRHRQDAQKDLDDMRAAGAVGDTREKGLEIMTAEARRIQLSAYLQAEAARHSNGSARRVWLRMSGGVRTAPRIKPATKT